MEHHLSFHHLHQNQQLKLLQMHLLVQQYLQNLALHLEKDLVRQVYANHHPRCMCHPL
mgnify:CR=1 FL=1